MSTGHIGKRNYSRDSSLMNTRYTGLSGPNVAPVPGAAYLLAQRQSGPGTSSATSGSIVASSSVTKPGIYFVDATSANVTISLLAATAYDAPVELVRVDTSSNTVTIVPSGAETINGATSLSLPYSNHVLTLLPNTTNWRVGYPTNQELADSSYSSLTSNDLTYWNGTRFTNRSIPTTLAVVLTTNGDILFRNGSGTVTSLPIGAANTIIASVGGIPVYTSLTGLKIAQQLFDHFVDANNGTTVETDLYSDTLVAGQLATNGDKLLTQYGGIFTGDATSTQRLKAYFGGTAIFDTGALAIGAVTSAWSLKVTHIRVSASVVRTSSEFACSNAALNTTAQYTEVTGLTLANTQVAKITGQAAGASGGSNQITAKEGYVQYAPAA